jgi:hypothetical protein
MAPATSGDREDRLGRDPSVVLPDVEMAAEGRFAPSGAAVGETDTDAGEPLARIKSCADEHRVARPPMAAMRVRQDEQVDRDPLG